MAKRKIEDQAGYVSDISCNWNYFPEIHAVRIWDIENLDDIKATIKAEFPETNPEEEGYRLYPKEKMLKDLQDCIYNGDHNDPGVKLDDALPDEDIKREKDELFRQINTYINDDSEIYITSIEKGLPIEEYIFWRFSYIIFNKQGESLFLFGSSYD